MKGYLLMAGGISCRKGHGGKIINTEKTESPIAMYSMRTKGMAFKK